MTLAASLVTHLDLNRSRHGVFSGLRLPWQAVRFGSGDGCGDSFPESIFLYFPALCCAAWRFGRSTAITYMQGKGFKQAQITRASNGNHRSGPLGRVTFAHVTDDAVRLKADTLKRLPARFGCGNAVFIGDFAGARVQEVAARLASLKLAALIELLLGHEHLPSRTQDVIRQRAIDRSRLPGTSGVVLGHNRLRNLGH